MHHCNREQREIWLPQGNARAAKPRFSLQSQARLLGMVTMMIDKAFETIPDGTELNLHSDYAEEKTMPKKSKVCMKHAA